MLIDIVGKHILLIKTKFIAIGNHDDDDRYDNDSDYNKKKGKWWLFCDGDDKTKKLNITIILL